MRKSRFGSRQPRARLKFLRSRRFTIIWTILCFVCVTIDFKRAVRTPQFIARICPHYEGPDLSVLLVIYNKYHYLNRSLTSIINLPIDPGRIQIICVDDGSTDNSTDIVQIFQKYDNRILLYKNEANLGTHMARVTAVLYTKSPYLTFLDPDDEFTGRGVQRALDFIKANNADIVEFGCQMVIQHINKTNMRCWRPPQVARATPAEYKKMFYRGETNCHVHRKIFRTEVYKAAIEMMPEWVLSERIIRHEDRLHYAFIVNAMTRNFHYLHVLGEIRYYGLPDNSQSEYYQSRSESRKNDRFVTRTIRRLFRHVVK